MAVSGYRCLKTDTIKGANCVLWIQTRRAGGEFTIRKNNAKVRQVRPEIRVMLMAQGPNLMLNLSPAEAL